MTAHPDNRFFHAILKPLAKIEKPKQHDEHVRAFLWETSDQGETVVRMPNGELERQEYIVNERTGERFVFTDKGTPVFAGWD